MKIFISYRRADSTYLIGRIKDRLTAAFGAGSVFRDLDDIPSGVDFRTVLEKETNECNVMLVVIGPKWAEIAYEDGAKRLFDPKDYTRIEVETGLKRLQDKKTMVVPVLILGAPMPSPKNVPESLVQLTYQNAKSVRDDPDFHNDMDKLIRDIRQWRGYAQDDIATEDFEPKTIYIGEGPFWMGSDPGEGIPDYETPKEKINSIRGYRIGKYPVTNLEYAAFIRQPKTRSSPPVGWNRQKIPEGLEKCPVVGVTWYDAWAYCQWLSEETNRPYSLPNEAQWEKACRGGNDFFFPWGNEFDATRCNHGQSAISPFDKYPPQNDFGCFDFVGNVQQWTCTLWGNERPMPDAKYVYPWKEDQRNDPNASREIYRVVRGSTYRQDVKAHRCSARRGEIPELSGMIGFRVMLCLE